MKIRFQSLAAITFALATFALQPIAEAVVPPPDGGYPGGNTAEGQDALLNLTIGTFNTAIGWFSLFSNAEGSFNTATGAGSLLFNTGGENTAFGAAALLFNTTGISNTAVGAAALLNNITGEDNTATGAFALSFNTEGFSNTAVGNRALQSNTNGESNTAVGAGALLSNNVNSDNTGIGAFALFSNTGGVANTANGAHALLSNTAGSDNTASGEAALFSNTTGGANTAIGNNALFTNTIGIGNTAVGITALFGNCTGNFNIAVGDGAGANVSKASHVICIGALGGDVSNTTWIDNVYGVTTQSGTTAQVIVSDTGQLGTVASSERFKKDIANMDSASEAILSLRPVSFHYKSDTKDTPQFGLIAEEVAKVNPALVLPDRDGKPYTVRYDAVNAMLLNEFLKEHRKVEELKSAMAQQRKEFEAVVARLNEQEARIQKVSAQVEMRKSGSQMLVENQ